MSLRHDYHMKESIAALIILGIITAAASICYVKGPPHIPDIKFLDKLEKRLLHHFMHSANGLFQSETIDAPSLTGKLAAAPDLQP